MKAYGYLRVSGLTQANEDASGLDRQRAVISQFAAAMDISIVQWFTEAYTGTDLENRPAFREMHTLLLADGVRTVVIEKLDRIARDLMVQETIIGRMRKHGVELVSATPGEHDLCSTDPTRKFIRQVLGAVAELDRSNLVSRMRDGKQRTGRWGGQRAYGINPEEQAAVQRVLALRGLGWNTCKIAAQLTSEGVPTRGGGKWFPAQISKIMRKNGVK